MSSNNVLTENQTQILHALAKDYPYYSKKCLKIITKDGQICPFVLNRAQMYLHSRIEAQKAALGRVRVVILKGRQQGCTTYIQGRYFHKTQFKTNLSAYILAHQSESTLKIYSMASKFQQNLPQGLKFPLIKNTERAMTLENGSSYTVGTAGSAQIGRGMTVHLFHGCLEGETLVVLASGKVKKIKDIQVGDIIRTHTNTLAPVTFNSKSIQNCVGIKIKGLQDFSLIASFAHRFLTNHGWCKAQDLKIGDKIAYSVPQITEQINSLPFALTVKPFPHHDRRPIKVPKYVKLTYELGRIFGLYLAEGCINGQGKLKHLSKVTFTVHEREAKRTLKWLKPFKKYFTNAKLYKRRASKTVTIEVHGRAFAELLAKYCGRKDEKGLPIYWAQWSKKCLKGVLHGYLSGDGHAETKTRRISAPSIRAAITTQMRDITAALGYGWASISYNPPAIRNGRNEQAQYVFRLTGSGVDRLCHELGWITIPRKRVGKYGDVCVEREVAWLPILNIIDMGNKEVFDLEIGHADHTYHTIHGVSHNSEVAFYENADELSVGLMQTVADVNGTEMIFESTANGPGNFFYDLCMGAIANKNGFELIFIPWYWQEEYKDTIPLSPSELTTKEAQYYEAYQKDGLTLHHLAWRRRKIAAFGDKEWKFIQEYPFNVDEAFVKAEGRFFDLAKVYAAKGRPVVVSDLAPLIIGVDQGRTGDDTKIRRRQGNKLFPIETISADDGQERDMRLAGRLARIIEYEKPDKIFIDTTNEHGALDRLHELGYIKIVKGVHFGEKAIDSERCRNKRTEMYIDFREWFEDSTASIPDGEQRFMSEVGAIPEEKETSNCVKYLVSKDDIKKDLGWSPDELDATVLTFAYPVKKRPQDQNDQRPRDQRASKQIFRTQLNTLKGVHRGMV